MADQPGYTRVPNELLELLPRLPNAEMRVMLVVIRKTTGWQAEIDATEAAVQALQAPVMAAPSVDTVSSLEDEYDAILAAEADKA